MLTRFTGTAENKAALVTQVPLGRLVLSEEVADGMCSSVRTKAGFITGTSSTSTADTAPTDHVRARKFAPRRKQRLRISF